MQLDGRRSPLLPTASLILAMMLWASSFIALKLAFRSYDPMVVIFGRMLVASLCFLAFIPRFRKVSYQMRDTKAILFMALCEPCLYFLFEAKAIANTTASQAGMIAALLPMMVAVSARIVLKETVTAKTWLGFMVALIGSVWLSVGGQPSVAAPNPPLGNFLEFLAMACATGCIITLKHLTLRYPPLFLTACQAFCGTLFYFPLLFLPGARWPLHIDIGGAAAIVYLGSFITLGAYGLYNFAVSRIPVSQASGFINLIPVFTVFLGWLILAERFTPSQYAAALLILAGIFISRDARPQLHLQGDP